MLKGIALALSLLGCSDSFESTAHAQQGASSAGPITHVAWCMCVQYAPGCGTRAAECLRLTDVAQFKDPLWQCVSTITASTPLGPTGPCG